MSSPTSAEQMRGAWSYSTAVLWVFLALVVASPWPYGSVGLREIRTITVVGFVVSIAACILAAWRRQRIVIVPVFWPVLGVLALAAAQLIPLPARVHQLVAPGSARFWHPEDPVVAEVLGPHYRPISVDPEATRRAVGLLGAVSILGLLSLPSLTHRRYRSFAVIVASLGGLVVALYGIVARLWFGNRLFGHLVVPTVAPFGSFVSKNHFAGYTEIAAFLALGLTAGLAEQSSRGASPLSWIESRRVWRVLAAFGASAAMGLAVLFCQSRGGFLGLTCGALAFALLRGHGARASRRHALVVAASLLAFGSAGLLLLPPPSQLRLLGLVFAGSDPAVQFRLNAWSASVRAAAESPAWGWGLGAFADALPPHKSAFGELRIEHAENEYLELFVEIGFVGLGLILLTGVFWVRGVGWALGPGERRRFARATAVGAAAGTIALCAHGLVDFNTRISSNALLFGLVATLAVSSCVRSPSGPLSVSGAGSALLLSMLLVIARPFASRIERPGPGSLRDRSGTSLRADLLELQFRDYLHQRPADAEAWALLGWLRAARGDPEGGQALIRYSGRLDPQRRELFENSALRAPP